RMLLACAAGYANGGAGASKLSCRRARLPDAAGPHVPPQRHPARRAAAAGDTSKGPIRDAEDRPMIKRTLPAVLLATTLALGGCGGSGDEAAPAAVAPVDLGAPSRIEEWSLPASLPGSASPSLATTPDGKLLLGWINSQK